MAGTFPDPINGSYPSSSFTVEPNQFEKSGHFGKYKKVIQITGAGDTFLTGSNYGAGAFLLENADTTIHFSGGGSISGSALNTKEVYEFSVSRVENNANGVVYVLIRNVKETA